MTSFFLLNLPFLNTYFFLSSHRDVKDENILLNSKTMQVKLIDFGCGTRLRDANYTEFAGTPEFYPPEWYT